MKREYIILRQEESDEFGGLETRGSKGAGMHPPLTLEVDELSERENELISRDPRVNTAANMETHLIGPLEVADAGPIATGEQAWSLEAVGAPAAWEAGYRGEGSTVAVLDTGIDKSHPAFAHVELTERDFTGEGNGDINGHGTHAAGTIFGGSVDGTAIGIAPGVSRAYVGKVLRDSGRGSTKMIVQGLNWAATDLGADVISLSLGINFARQFDRLRERHDFHEERAHSQTLIDFAQNIRMFDRIMERIRSARPFEEGSIVVAATGNNSQPEFRVATSMPAFSSGVISVGATDRGLQSSREAPALHRVADFSNAPPTLVAPGVNIISARAGGGLARKSGTSMATPHVAGLAALWWQFVRRRSIPNSPANVEAQLFSSCRYDVFTPETIEDDRGSGLVTAPVG